MYFAPAVLTTEFHMISDVVTSAVLVLQSKGQSIRFPPAANRTLFGSAFWGRKLHRIRAYVTIQSFGIVAISSWVINLTVSVPLVSPHPWAIRPSSLHMAASHTSRNSGTLMILAYLVIVSLVMGCTTPFAISCRLTLGE